MWTLKALCIFYILCGGFALDYYPGSSYFCTNLTPQGIVDISQLEGIWYVIEKILHTEERHYIVNATTCPVIHISEDRSHLPTYNPAHKTYEATYGSGYPYNPNKNTNFNPTDPRSTFSSEQDYIKKIEEYDRHTTYDYERRRLSHTGYMKHLTGFKYLRIYWDDSVYSTEYHLRYNVSQPGFWISSGPEGSPIPEDRKHFAGTIQVIKAVGNHLVLTFCHRLPENQLFTVILSRENRLDDRDISNVHSMLIRKGLSTNAVEKSCNSAHKAGVANFLVMLLFSCYLTTKL